MRNRSEERLQLSSWNSGTDRHAELLLGHRRRPSRRDTLSSQGRPVATNSDRIRPTNEENDRHCKKVHSRFPDPGFPLASLAPSFVSHPTTPAVDPHRTAVAVDALSTSETASLNNPARSNHLYSPKALCESEQFRIPLSIRVPAPMQTHPRGFPITCLTSNLRCRPGAAVNDRPHRSTHRLQTLP